MKYKIKILLAGLVPPYTVVLNIQKSKLFIRKFYCLKETNIAKQKIFSNLDFVHNTFNSNRQNSSKHCLIKIFK